MELNTAPDPILRGEYRGMTDEEYHGETGFLGSTWIKKAASLTPAHAYAMHEMMEDADDTALVVGAAFHCLVLRPDDFKAEYIDAGPLDLRKKDDKAKYAGLTATASATGKVVLRDKEMAVAERLAAAALADPEIVNALASCELREVAYFAEVPLSDGRTCPGKAKFDALSPGQHALDLKSHGGRATDHAVAAAARDWGWPIQCAWYNRVCAAAGHEAPADWWFAVVEKAAPNIGRLMQMPQEVIEAADEACDAMARLWLDCNESGQRPAYMPGVIDVPPYYVDRLRTIGGGL